jgi:MFS family permease
MLRKGVFEYFNHPSPAMQGFMTSVYDLGCFLGAIITLFVGERLGRRWTMLVFTVIMGSGIVLQTASHNTTQMVIPTPGSLQNRT